VAGGSEGERRVHEPRNESGGRERDECSGDDADPDEGQHDEDATDAPAQSDCETPTEEASRNATTKVLLRTSAQREEEQ
jgi:hypothetical protein